MNFLKRLLAKNSIIELVNEIVETDFMRKNLDKRQDLCLSRRFAKVR